jgi:hypothetical protein
MAQDELVDEQIEYGKGLINALVADGLEIPVAFWARPTEEGEWFLYLASPLVDEKGPTVVYRRALNVLRQMSGGWIDPFDLKVVGMEDTMAQAALAVTRPKNPDSPFAVLNPKPHQGMTRFGGSKLGGVAIDGSARIYPPPPVAPAA